MSPRKDMFAPSPTGRKIGYIPNSIFTGGKDKKTSIKFWRDKFIRGENKHMPTNDGTNTYRGNKGRKGTYDVPKPTSKKK